MSSRSQHSTKKTLISILPYLYNVVKQVATQDQLGLSICREIYSNYGYVGSSVVSGCLVVVTVWAAQVGFSTLRVATVLDEKKKKYFLLLFFLSRYPT